jgi:hypothetical protein
MQLNENLPSQEWQILILYLKYDFSKSIRIMYKYIYKYYMYYQTSMIRKSTCLWDGCCYSTECAYSEWPKILATVFLLNQPVQSRDLISVV